MKRVTRVALVLAAVVAAAGIGLGAFIGSGVYNIGADEHHTRIALALIGQLRERSIAVRASAIEVPASPESVAARPG
jgi:uncharacterized protein (UPF0212 family)